MIKILIVDDQNFTRQALQAILEAEPDFEVIGQATSGSDAIEQMETQETDITIVDLEMPEMNGLTTTKIINQRFSNTKVIILSSHDDEASINAAVEAGVRGYLLKNTSTQEIADTIRAVQRGYFQLGPGLFEKLLSHLIHEKEDAARSLSELEQKYAQSMVNLEKKIFATNESQRQELYTEIEQQINSLKQDFRDGLENFQYQVSNQLQSGLEAANTKFSRSIPNLQEIEIQIDNRNLEQQRYINTLFAGSKQAIQKLESQLNQMRYFVGIAVIVFVAITMLLTY
ncbi:MAG: response regulator transcription factor [Cyanobacteria bacterium P01_G01_bin.19]